MLIDAQIRFNQVSLVGSYLRSFSGHFSLSLFLHLFLSIELVPPKSKKLLNTLVPPKAQVIKGANPRHMTSKHVERQAKQCVQYETQGMIKPFVVLGHPGPLAPYSLVYVGPAALRGLRLKKICTFKDLLNLQQG